MAVWSLVLVLLVGWIPRQRPRRRRSSNRARATPPSRRRAALRRSRSAGICRDGAKVTKRRLIVRAAPDVPGTSDGARVTFSIDWPGSVPHEVRQGTLVMTRTVKRPRDARARSYSPATSRPTARRNPTLDTPRHGGGGGPPQPGGLPLAVDEVAPDRAALLLGQVAGSARRGTRGELAAHRRHGASRGGRGAPRRAR